MHVLSGQATLVGVRGCFAGFEGVEWPEKALPVGFRRRSKVSTETRLAEVDPHGIGVADSPCGCVILP